MTGSNTVVQATSPILQEATKHNYRFERFLASGRSGPVILASPANHQPHQQVVIKAMTKDDVKPEWVQNERRAGLLLKQKGLVKYVDSWEDAEHDYLVVDYVKGDDLWQFLQNRNWKPLTEKEARLVVKQVAKAIKYCHSNGVAHKDIKLENVMIDKKLHTTLIDFGFCEFIRDNHLSKRFDGTLDYMPPEELLRMPFDPFKADVFALGVVLYILVTGSFPFEWKKRCRQMAKGQIPRVNWTQPDLPQPSQALKQLLEGMLETSSHARLSLDDVLQHPWMKRASYLDRISAMLPLS
jgi:serine/threonine protein kinase